MRLVLAGALTIAFSLPFGAKAVHAQSAADFYKGRQLTMLIAATAGGGYDRWARLVSRHIVKHVPGNPSIINQNMGAAGGISGTAHIYTVLAKDARREIYRFLAKYLNPPRPMK